MTHVQPNTQTLCPEFVDPTIEDQGRGFSAPIILSCELPNLLTDGAATLVWINGLPTFIPIDEEDIVSHLANLTALAALTTTSLAVPYTRIFYVTDADEVQAWQLRASTAATETGQVQRPADYSAGNTKVWFRIVLA